jgi:hypothetical protein
MEFVRKRLAIFEGALPALPTSGGIATLDYEARDDAMERCAIVVPIQAMLQEVARGQWRLLRKELEEDVACGGLKEDFGGRLRF